MVIVALEDAPILNEIPVLQVSANSYLEGSDPLGLVMPALNDDSRYRGRFGHINLRICVTGYTNWQYKFVEFIQARVC